MRGIFKQLLRLKFIQYAKEMGVSTKTLREELHFLSQMEAMSSKDHYPDTYIRVLSDRIKNNKVPYYLHHFLILEIDKFFRLENLLHRKVFIEIGDEERKFHLYNSLKELHMAANVPYVFLNYNQYSFTLTEYERLARKWDSIILVFEKFCTWNSEMLEVIETILPLCNLIIVTSPIQKGQLLPLLVNDFELLIYLNDFELFIYLNDELKMAMNLESENTQKKMSE